MRRGENRNRAFWRGSRTHRLLTLAVACAGLNGACLRAQAADSISANYIKTNFVAAEARYRREPTNAEAAWQLGRAIFDRADLSTNNTERALFADEGIAACEMAVSREPKSAPAHYYLGMNLGQLARTKDLSALKIVKRMEKEFIRACELDEAFDYAGPQRNIGLLYREAPPVLSIGSKKDARQHLRRALELAPQYPENRLNLIEAYIKWSEEANGRVELKALDGVWNGARTNFTGVAWVGSWRIGRNDGPRRARCWRETSDRGAQASTRAVQWVAPKWALNFSASVSAADFPWINAKVVEPLPDMSAAAAPLARRNS